jgi:GTP-binding protein
MDIRHVSFIKSSPDLKSCPGGPSHPEFAFAGRSNVGKSSLINMLVDLKRLAKTSSTPGKTRYINHFLVDDSWYLVDLPGYGYARTSKETRSMFHTAISEYLLKRMSLACLLLLIDCRHAPLENDLGVIRWLGVNKIPFVLVFTKADKIGASGLKASVDRYRQTMLEEWEDLPRMFITSAVKHSGRDEILDFIEETCRHYGG